MQSEWSIKFEASDVHFPIAQLPSSNPTLDSFVAQSNNFNLPSHEGPMAALSDAFFRCGPYAWKEIKRKRTP
jgi:hypothetical protein